MKRVKELIDCFNLALIELSGISVGREEDAHSGSDDPSLGVFREVHSVHFKIVSHTVNSVLRSSVEMELVSSKLSWTSNIGSKLGVEEGCCSLVISKVWGLDLCFGSVSNPLYKDSLWE